MAFGFRKLKNYGLQAPLQLGVPSAWAIVGTTKALRKSTAAAIASRARFTIVFLLVWKSEP
jgi:hypothetical protein